MSRATSGGRSADVTQALRQALRAPATLFEVRAETADTIRTIGHSPDEQGAFMMMRGAAEVLSNLDWYVSEGETGESV